MWHGRVSWAHPSVRLYRRPGSSHRSTRVPAVQLVLEGFVTSQGSPAATVVLGTHTYAAAGIYVVTIAVSDSAIPVTASGRFLLMAPMSRSS